MRPLTPEAIADNRIPTDANFWRMGPTGPCGPCTEIFYDHGDHIWGGPPGSADEDGDRFIEIWNNVFMQNEQFADGTMRPLDMQSIDTGMGLERIGALLQGKHDNYDTDLMRSLIEASAHAKRMPPATFGTKSLVGGQEGGITPVSGEPKWEFIGPKALSVPYNIYYGPPGSSINGRISGLAFDPFSASTMYMAAPAGGI
mgnify:CR=1 FL=1